MLNVFAYNYNYTEKKAKIKQLTSCSNIMFPYSNIASLNPKHAEYHQDCLVSIPRAIPTNTASVDLYS